MSAYPNVIRVGSVYLLAALGAGAAFILVTLVIAYPYEVAALACTLYVMNRLAHSAFEQGPAALTAAIRRFEVMRKRS